MQDWRDSIITKTLAWTSVGLLFYGTYELKQHEDRRFCEEYGWLRNNQPEEVQLEYANKLFDESPVNEGYRNFAVKHFLKDIKKCE